VRDLVVAFFGARGQGKSTQAKQYLALHRPARLLIWDTMNEYGAHAERVESLSQILARARAGRMFGLRYVPPAGSDAQLAARFDAFCAIAYELGELLLLVEELQRVTKPSWAPPAWSDCTLRGRHRGLSIFGLSQRPASVDKNFFTNCSTVSSCRLNFSADVACIAGVLGVERDRIVALPRYRYIARDMTTGAVTEGSTVPPEGAKAPRRGSRRRRKRA
jgi:hypothetical protein